MKSEKAGAVWIFVKEIPSKRRCSMGSSVRAGHCFDFSDIPFPISLPTFLPYFFTVNLLSLLFTGAIDLCALRKMLSKPSFIELSCFSQGCCFLLSGCLSVAQMCYQDIFCTVCRKLAVPKLFWAFYTPDLTNHLHKYEAHISIQK